MDPGEILNALVAALAAALILAVAGGLRFHARRRLAASSIGSSAPRRQVSRRRRRRSLGKAHVGHDGDFELEDISATGAFIRTDGGRRLKIGKRYTLDLVLSEVERASVRARVVRKQAPHWKKNLIGGVGVLFEFQDNDPNQKIIDDYVAEDEKSTL